MLNKKRLDAFRLITFTPTEQGIYSRLPDVYKKFYDSVFNTEPKPIYYEPKEGRFKKDPETGLITPVQNIPVPTLLPRQLHQVLLGGELVVRGFTKKDNYSRRVPHFWVPALKRSVVYSEILNKHFAAVITDRLVMQIHEFKGFDNYLLMSDNCDLKTSLALKMKKKILTALADKDLPYDDRKNEELYERYKKYLIPKEELEWFGLTLWEATQKQLKIEDDERRKAVPLKFLYRQNLIDRLKSGVADEEEEEPAHLEEQSKGWLSKLAKPFSSNRA